MKAFPLDSISTMSSTELITKLENGEMSLLKSFSVNHMRFLKRMIVGPRPAWSQISGLLSWTLGLFVMNYIVGPICRFVLWCVLLGGGAPKDENYWKKKRVKAVRVVRFFFPDQVLGTTPDIENQGLIVGFNHPTLHEILSLIAWALDRFPKRRNNYPTNLPWYESICTCAPTLKKLGICITPLITQSTFKKLEKVHQGDEKMIGAISKVSELLLSHYFSVAIDFERSGDNTFAAPSSTRQVTIFPKGAAFHKDPGAVKLLPAMSGLMFRIARAGGDRKPEAIFLPVTVIPPKLRIKWLKGLKPFSRYSLIIGRGFSMEEAKKLGRGIDYAFLKRLAENAPEELWYPKPDIKLQFNSYTK